MIFYSLLREFLYIKQGKKEGKFNGKLNKIYTYKTYILQIIIKTLWSLKNCLFRLSLAYSE